MSRTFLAPATCVRSWAVISARYTVPIMITGFEPMDTLEGVLKVMR
jgi:hydrogenase maturation factor